MNKDTAWTSFFVVLVVLTALSALTVNNVLGRNAAVDIIDTSAAPPGKPTLVSPAGTIYIRDPVFVWNAVPDAIRYWLKVTDSSGSGRADVFVTIQEAGCAAGTGTCSFNIGGGSGLGNLSWQIQAINDTGAGPWSDSLSLFIPPEPAPVGTSAPSGVIIFVDPTYSATASFSASLYRLRVVDSSGFEKVDALYTPEELGCTIISECLATPSATLAVGVVTAGVQPYNDTNGYGVWSYPLTFG
jgi:hypothetical protein